MNYLFKQNQIKIQGCGGVVIGNNTIIAGNCFISSSDHDFSDPKSNNFLKNEIPMKTIIGKHCWIAANVCITSGVIIGDYCVIGAGSVVTKDLPSFTVAVGSPCKVIKNLK